MDQNETAPASTTLTLEEAQNSPDRPIVPGGFSLAALRALSQYTTSQIGPVAPVNMEQATRMVALFQAQFPAVSRLGRESESSYRQALTETGRYSTRNSES